MNRREFIIRGLGGSAALLLAATPFRLLARSTAAIPVERIYVALGTTVRFQVYHPHQREALEAIRKAADRVQQIHDRMSVQDPRSTLSAWNRSRHGAEVLFDALTAGALQAALQAVQLTGGRFDPTVGAAVQAITEGRAPLYQADRLGEWRPEERRLIKPHRGVALDLGGSAKGWAVDRAMEILIASGCQAALVNAGGDLRVFGAPPGQSAWPIGIRDPRNPDEVLRVVQLRDSAIATSGNGAGEGLATLIDPRDFSRIHLQGSISVQAPQCGLADALSTSLCVEPNLDLLPTGTAGLIALQNGNDFLIQQTIIADTH